MIRTIPIINNKGGVGKTTTTVNLAAGLARQGQNVLVVDLDSQGSASLALGTARDDLEPSIASVLYGTRHVTDTVRTTAHPNLDLIPGSLSLADADVQLSRETDRHTRLLDALAPIREAYDTILIDCAPSTSLLSINALVAADAFIIPVAPSYLSLEGVISLGNVVSKVRRGLGEAAPVLGVLLTLVRRDDDQTRRIIEEVRRHYGGKVFDTEIRDDPAVEDAPGYGRSVFDHAPDSQGARDYATLVEEMIRRAEQYGEVYQTVNHRRRAAALRNQAAGDGAAPNDTSTPPVLSPSNDASEV